MTYTYALLDKVILVSLQLRLETIQVCLVGLCLFFLPLFIVDSSGVVWIDSCYLLYNFLVVIDISSVNGVTSSQLESVEGKNR